MKSPLARFFLLLILLASSMRGAVAGRPVGDVDNDGVVTALDLVRQIASMNSKVTLSETDRAYADVNGDGVNNDADSAEIVRLILGTRDLATLAPAKVLETSPAAGASGVALTREFIVRFSMPLALETTLTSVNPTTKAPGNFFATFGGKQILSRAEVSGDRRKATLFFLEPLPASARVRVTFNPTGLKDLLGRDLDPTGSGAAGVEASYDFDTLSISALTGTAVVGKVYGVEVGTTGTGTSRPLAGVTISVNGAEQTLRVKTGADGKFTLNPAPVGKFFVTIDGRTATGAPAGGYYAFVGKAWEGVPGQVDTPATVATATTVAGDIYLPFIPTGTLQAVSQTAATTITFAPAVLAANPSLAGVKIEVPAGSLFADNGTRGGKVGIAPVSPDRLPEPLPPGLNLPLVITIQTDGATNFDRPVPVRFPNLPDKVTGVKLAPGAKSALWSFNHDTGLWEIAGPMTVTADGNYVETDAGVGVRQPGWHGTQPSCPVSAPPNQKCPDKDLGDLLNISKNWINFVVNCLPEFVKSSVKALKVLEKMKEAVEVVQGIRNFDAAFREGRLKREIARDILVSFRDKIEEILKDAEEDQSEYLKIFDFALDCVGAYEDLNAKALCDKVQPESCFTDAEKNICAERDQRKKHLEDLRSGIVEEKTKVTLKISILRWAKLEIDKIINNFDNTSEVTLNQIRSKKEGGLRSAATLSLSDQLSQLVKSMEPVSSFDKTLETEVRVDFDNHAEFSATMGVLDALIFGGRPNSYYCVQYSGNEIRSKTDALGGFQFSVPPDTPFIVSVYEPINKLFGMSFARTGSAGVQTIFDMPALGSLSSENVDSDGESLPDVVEFVIGTDPTKADTDGDGILDGAEVRNGSNPLDGKPAAVGIIANRDTAGIAVDVAATNGLAAVADGTAGVVLYDVSNPLSPLRIAQVDTPGDAHAVAFGTGSLAVADGAAGLAVVDLSDPPAARIIRQPTFNANVNAVAVNGTFGYVGLSDGSVALVDLVSGGVMQRKSVSTAAVQDLVVGQEALYVYTVGQVYAIALVSDEMGAVTSLSVTGVVGSGGRRLRLVYGGDRLYAIHSVGVNVISISSPLTPTLLKANATAQFGWKQLVPNGSGLAVAAVDPVGTNDGAHDISLYTVGSEGTIAFQTTLATPGLASAVAIYNGLAYVADGAAGLQVVNYLAYDNKMLAPTISIATGFSSVDGVLQVEEGKLGRVSATVTDDVQVRNVEFYVDGQLAENDGGFPFEYRFVTPALAPGKTTFTLQAKAIDTGGNITSSNLLTYTLTPDKTSPRPVLTFPNATSLGVALNSIRVYFDEPIQAVDTLPTYALLFLGADGVFGGGDDVVVPFSGKQIADRRELRLALATTLPSGNYRLTIPASAIGDLAFNPLAQDLVVNFSTRLGGVPNTSYWISQTGDWFNASNWSSGAVPGTNDTVIVDFGTMSMTGTHTVTAKKVTVATTLAMSDAFITFKGAWDVTGQLVLDQYNSIIVDGWPASFNYSGPLALDSADLVTMNGGVISLPGATKFVGRANGGFFDRRGATSNITAIGAGSQVLVPAITEIASGAGIGPTIQIYAQTGGVVDLSGVTAISTVPGGFPGETHPVKVLADGTGSLVRLGQLTSFIDSSTATASTMEAKNGGYIQAPSLTYLSGVYLTIRDIAGQATSQMKTVTSGGISVVGVTANFSGVTSIANSAIELKTGGKIDLNQASIIDGADFLINDGVTLHLPAATGYLGRDFPGNGTSQFVVSGVGSVLDLSSLKTVRSAGGIVTALKISALAGGVIDLDGVTAFSTPAPWLPNAPTSINVLADGSGSQVQLGALISFIDSSSQTESSLEAKNGGVISLPLLTNSGINGVTLIGVTLKP